MRPDTVTVASATPLGFGSDERDAVIERVAGGCGPGFHPNRFGDCRPNFRGGYGYGGPRGYYGDRPGYGYGRGYERGYESPRRFYGGY
ncbi:GCG_CRPN prefix-to-repeats domain-containing protein [Methylobacterium gnaphalii]|uniref:GCG_CRPN prefix-to-repeats domain-containing protein n=1 Tax=Methylobacterium gnaphalii TaxID=1010610 RepID=UPI00235BAFAC|nr:hypothetical protein [Methylobacterium gnaphalii]GLS48923.1 hypothetical protein GCM10007885_17700 [Methylobacterium gnaphalii]